VSGCPPDLEPCPLFAFADCLASPTSLSHLPTPLPTHAHALPAPAHALPAPRPRPRRFASSRPRRWPRAPTARRAASTSCARCGRLRRLGWGGRRARECIIRVQGASQEWVGGGGKGPVFHPESSTEDLASSPPPLASSHSAAGLSRERALPGLAPSPPTPPHPTPHPIPPPSPHPPRPAAGLPRVRALPGLPLPLHPRALAARAPAHLPLAHGPGAVAVGVPGWGGHLVPFPHPCPADRGDPAASRQGSRGPAPPYMHTRVRPRPLCCPPPHVQAPTRATPTPSTPPCARSWRLSAGGRGRPATRWWMRR
jgi:hypothetical protein